MKKFTLKSFSKNISNNKNRPLLFIAGGSAVLLGAFFLFNSPIQKQNNQALPDTQLTVTSPSLLPSLESSPTPKPTIYKPKPSPTPSPSPTPDPAADLIISQVMFIPNKNEVQAITMIPGNGDSMTIDKNDGGFTVWPTFKNIGTVTARDVKINYYLNGTLKTTGEQSLIEPNTEKGDGKENPSFPSDSGQTYEVRIVINEDKKVPESNYGNNSHTFKYTIR